MTVHTLNPLEDSRWATFVQGHPQTSVCHTAGWLQAMRLTYGYEPVVYTTCPPTATLTNGIVLCRVSSWLTGRRLVSLPFVDHCEPLVEDASERRELLTALQHAVDEEHLKYVEIRPLTSDLQGEAGLETCSSFCFHQLDLRPSLDQLLRNTHKNAVQSQIRRAEREALSYEEGRSDALLSKFYELLLLTRRRHKLPPQPIQWFRNLAVCLGDQLRIRVASKEKRPIASILTLSCGDTLVYKYGCSDASSHNLGAIPFLLWHAIREAKETGLQKLDLGRSDCDNTGLITFKERWGATRSMLTYIRCSARRVAAPHAGYGMDTAKRVFARMPDCLLTTAGRLLYRHIG